MSKVRIDLFAIVCSNKMEYYEKIGVPVDKPIKLE